MKNNKNGIPLIVLTIIIAIGAVIIICISILIKQKIYTSENIEIINKDITTIDEVTLIYGMDDCNSVEIPILENASEIVVVSNDETIAKVSVENNILKIEAICDDIKETTINLTYSGIEKIITVYVKPSCLVMFNTNGGTEVMPQMVVYEGNVMKPENPTKDENVFVCWCIDEELTEEYDFNLPVIEDMTLYAKYENAN